RPQPPFWCWEQRIRPCSGSRGRRRPGPRSTTRQRPSGSPGRPGPPPAFPLRRASPPNRSCLWDSETSMPPPRTSPPPMRPCAVRPGPPCVPSTGSRPSRSRFRPPPPPMSQRGPSAPPPAPTAASDTAEAAKLPTDTAAAVEAVTVGAGLGAYRFLDYRSEGKTPGELTVIAPKGKSFKAAHDSGAVIAAATNRARDLVNTPPLDLYPESYAEIVR